MRQNPDALLLARFVLVIATIAVVIAPIAADIAPLALIKFKREALKFLKD